MSKKQADKIVGPPKLTLSVTDSERQDAHALARARGVSVSRMFNAFVAREKAGLTVQFDVTRREMAALKGICKHQGFASPDALAKFKAISCCPV